MAPRVEVPLALVVTQPIVSQSSMEVEEQKMLGKFLILSPPKFIGSPNEDAYEFLDGYEKRINNLCLIKVNRVNYFTFQFDLTARQWWIRYINSRLAGSPSTAWTQFLRLYQRSICLTVIENI